MGLSGIKGFMFKDFYISRKNYFLTYLIWLILVVIGILMRLSILYGNLSKIAPEDMAGTETSMFYVSIYIPMLVAIFNSEYIESIYCDYSSKWCNVCYVTPYAEEKSVLSRFLLSFIMMCAGTIFSVVNAVVMCLLNGRMISSLMMSSFFVIVLFSSLCNVVNCCLAYTFREPKKAAGVGFGIFMAIYIIMLCLAYIVMYAFADKLNGKEDEDGLLLFREFALWFQQKIGPVSSFINYLLPLLIIAVFVVGYFACIKIVKRRDKNERSSLQRIVK